MKYCIENQHDIYLTCLQCHLRARIRIAQGSQTGLLTRMVLKYKANRLNQNIPKSNAIEPIHMLKDKQNPYK